MANENEEFSESQVLAFAKTLRGKSAADQVGQLMLAFEGMDLISAKAIIIIIQESDNGRLGS